MKKTLTLILLFTEILLFAQAKPYLDYHKGTKIIKRRGLVLNNTFHKEWKYYSKEGKLKAIGNWDKGIKEGEWKFFDNKGKITSKGNYNKNLKNGEWKNYKYGVLSKKENYLNGKKNGIYTRYYDGKISIKGNFEKGLASGKWTGFYTYGINEGKPEFELKFTKDWATKPIKTKFYYNEKQDYRFSSDPYYSVGSVIIEEDLDNGFYMEPNYHGKYKGYYKDGKLFCKGEYINDKENGFWVFYHKNGKILAEGEFKDGEVNGFWKEYHKNGELASTGKYDNNGNKIGIWKWWHDNKQLSEEVRYVKNPASSIYNCAVGISIGYHKNGTLRYETDFGNEIKNGKCPKRLKEVFYNNEGQITHYNVGREDGYSKYNNGRVGTKWSYNNDIYAQKRYFESGKLKEESFKKYNPKSDEYDIKTGIWKFYNEDGSLKESIDYSKKR